MLRHQNGSLLQLEDAEIYYQVSGSPTGHPLLLLHGGLGSLEDFSAIAGSIPEHFFVIAVDLRGHGRSTIGRKPLSYLQHQLDIQALIAHLNLNEYSILGFSDGGIVGYRLAIKNAAIRALVTVGAQWRISDQDACYEILSGVTPETWTEIFPDAPRKYSELNPHGNFAELVQSCTRLWTDLGPAGYPGDAIALIQCPTLILRGDSDFLLSLEEAADAQTMINGASLGNIPFCSHAAIEESPDIAARLICDFLNEPRKRHTDT
jgi:pimeloyl-ACP methyl ester carboxylesterase